MLPASSVSTEEISVSSPQEETPLYTSEDPLARRLSALKLMSTNTPEEVEEKRFEGIKLSMDSLLNKAFLWDHLIDLMVQDPNSTDIELTEKLKSVASSRAVEKIISSVMRQKHAVLKTLNLVQEWSNSSDSKSPAELIFAGYSDGQYPTHPARLVPNSLAVTVYLHPDDFIKVDPKENLAGFFVTTSIKEPGSVIEELKLTPITPFIFVRDDIDYSVDDIKKHEDRHAKNKIFITSLYALGCAFNKSKSTEGIEKFVKRYWGIPSESIIFSPSNDASILKDWWGDPVSTDKMKESLGRRRQNLLTYALSRAKDEVLAAMEEDNPYGRLDEHLVSLKTEGGVYDYFQNLGIDPSSELYKSLTLEYHTLLDQQVELALKMSQMYMGRYYSTPILAFPKRAQLFTSLLMQIPMSSWNKRLESSGFVLEMQKIQELQQSINLMHSYTLVDRSLSSKISSEGLQQINTEIRNLTERFIDEVNKHPELHYFDIVEKYQNIVDGLQKQAQEIEMYQANKLIEEFKRWRSNLRGRVIPIMSDTSSSRRDLAFEFSNHYLHHFPDQHSIADLKSRIKQEKQGLLDILDQLLVEHSE